MMDSDSDPTDDDEDYFHSSVRNPFHGVLRHARHIAPIDSDDSDEEPPRRRIRIMDSLVELPPSPEVVLLRDCRVRVPRITAADVPSQTQSQPPPPVPSSSTARSSTVTSRITTRAASAAAAMAASSAATHGAAHSSPHSTATATATTSRYTAAAGDSSSLDSSSSGISGMSLIGEFGPTNPLSTDTESESEFARSWLNRRYIRRNAAAFLHADEDDDDDDDDDIIGIGDGDDEGLSSVMGDNEVDNLLDQMFQDEADRDLALPTLSSGDSSSNDGDDSNGGELRTLTTLKPKSAQSEPQPGPSPKLDESARSADDEEGLTCLICYEHFTNSGEHRISCLKCGHTYGKACIEKWIRQEGRCPQCNAKASRKDVRILYVKNLKAIDTVERDKLNVDLEREKELKRKLELECARLRQMNQCRDLEFVKLNREVIQLREKIGGVYRDATSSEAISSAVSNSKGFAHLKYLDFKDGEFRVGAYNQWLSMTAISQTLKSALYPSGCYGIKRINMLDLKTMQTTPIHQKEIRDLQFNSMQNDLLLSVGMDKKAMLTNCQSNVIVQTFNTPQQLWSCTWNAMCQHLFYVGTNNGQIITYDLRNPQSSVNVVTIPTDDKSPIAKMHFVTPSYQNSSFSLSGLIVQKLNSCWFCEIRNEKEIFHQLPVEGSFSSIDFESKSRHMLISTRPGAKHPGGRHLVCELNQYFSEAQDTNICSCNVVQTFEGGQTGLGKMSRSSIFSPVAGTVLVGANGSQSTVNLWNVSDVNMKQTIQIREPILDFVPCQVNDNFLLGMISSNGVQVYKHI